MREWSGPKYYHQLGQAYTQKHSTTVASSFNLPNRLHNEPVAPALHYEQIHNFQTPSSFKLLWEWYDLRISLFKKERYFPVNPFSFKIQIELELIYYSLDLRNQPTTRPWTQIIGGKAEV